MKVRDVPGFLVNLLGRAYITEALHIQHEGVASVATIDRIMREAAGFRMGPFELMDLTGIDVNLPATRVVYEGFQHDPRLKTTALHELLSRRDSSDARPVVGSTSTARGGLPLLPMTIPAWRPPGRCPCQHGSPSRRQGWSRSPGEA